jgi:serine/threonine-protein kinase RsbW
MPRYIFTYPSIGESETRMLDELEGVLRKHQVDLVTAHQFKLAISEAFTNALVHGNCRNANKIITVELQVNESRLRADITDQGSGGLQRIERRKPPDPFSENGRGVDLIRHYATDVEFRESDSGGVVVSIRLDRTMQSERECS